MKLVRNSHYFSPNQLLMSWGGGKGGRLRILQSVRER